MRWIKPWARWQKAGFEAQSGAIIITSRASFEMVQKSAAMGIGIVAAVSAPTAAATPFG
jgi:FdhD protein